MKAVSRANGWAGRAIVPLLIVLTAYPPSRLTAQVSLRTALGARASSTLVHDSIAGEGVDVRPPLAVALALEVRMPLHGAWLAEAGIDVSVGRISRRDTSGTTDLGGLSSVAFGVALVHGLPAGLSARAGIAGLRYLPGAKTGIFRDGAPAVAALGSLAVRWAPPTTSAIGRRRLGLELRYDVHGFMSPALRHTGFDQSRPVHRIALLVTAEQPIGAAR